MTLILAIIAIESGGDNLAHGRHGEVGALQVRACVVRDVNRHHGTHYTLASMTNRARASEVFNLYLDTYATEKRLGRPVTDEDRARIWHRGPRGYLTDRSNYAARVTALERGH